MAPRLASALALASLICLAFAGTAAAASPGLSGQRAVERVAERAERTASTSSLIASTTACPDQSGPESSVAAQQAMLCMTNFARASAGLGPLAEAEELNRSAGSKAGDVLQCNSFSHFACGREFTYWIRETGYIGEGCWHAGENIAWGTGEYGSVRAIFRAWMNSPTHRKNILGDYDQVGISLLTGNLEGHNGARVWVSHFGSHC